MFLVLSIEWEKKPAHAVVVQTTENPVPVKRVGWPEMNIGPSEPLTAA